MVRFCLVNMGQAQAKRLLIITHHLVMDSVSWDILLEDLENGCRQVLRGEMRCIFDRLGPADRSVERGDLLGTESEEPETVEVLVVAGRLQVEPELGDDLFGILRLIDLLNGASDFDPWITRQLPDCPSAP